MEDATTDVVDVQRSPLVVQQVKRGNAFFPVYGLNGTVGKCVCFVTGYHINAVECDFGNNQLFTGKNPVYFKD